MESLAKQEILSYSKYDKPLTDEQISEYMEHLPEWEVVDQEGVPSIESELVDLCRKKAA